MTAVFLQKTYLRKRIHLKKNMRMLIGLQLSRNDPLESEKQNVIPLQQKNEPKTRAG